MCAVDTFSSSNMVYFSNNTIQKILLIAFSSVFLLTNFIPSILFANTSDTQVFKNESNEAAVLAVEGTSESIVPPQDAEGMDVGDVPRSLELSSQVFVDQNNWYNKTDGSFTWVLPLGASAVAYEITYNPDNSPEESEDTINELPVEEFTINDQIVTDGIQYVSVNFKDDEGWGVPTNRRLQIDTVEPEPFTIKIYTDSYPNAFPRLNFEAKDVISGIDYYEILIADRELILVTSDEARTGYILKELEDGSYTVKVSAYDRAGNVRESSSAVLVTAGWIKPVEVTSEGLFSDSFIARSLFILFLIVLIGLQGSYICYIVKRNKMREAKLLHETREIQDQMEKIFSALRAEIYDQIISITKRKRLTNKETEAIEGLTEALDVSQILIEKEINDVKVLLK